jgi:hypothetical protein
MKRISILAIKLTYTLSGCNGQKGKKEIADTVKMNAPKTDIRVNKEYDKNGNLIKYDSTYSYFYSNTNNNDGKRDSILENFKNHFNQNYFFSNEPYFHDLFFQDSLLKYDFYKKDFFYDRFRQNMKSMDRLFREMDSLKNGFYKEQLKPVPKKSGKL